MTKMRSATSRLLKSAVWWSWVYNGLRLASGIILLPLLVQSLPEPDLGMYFIFLSLIGLLPVVDAAFSVNIGRHIGYAMGGATQLQAEGMAGAEIKAGTNYDLVWQLFPATRLLYRYLALGIAVVLGAGGSFIVSLRVQETSQPGYAWLAWGICVLAAVWDIYSGWWNVFLRGMNEVVASARLAVVSQAVRLVVASILLLGGTGLLALPLATLLSSFLQRLLARRHCSRLLATAPPPTGLGSPRDLLRIIWPNCWRVGLKLASLYLASLGLATICTIFLGLNANAQYGLSLQIVVIIQSLSLVWTGVKWPLINQLRARHDLDHLRKVLWPRIWLQNLTFVVLTLFALPSAEPLLHLLQTDKQVLPLGLWFLLAANGFLELQFSTWTHLLTTENRVPSLQATVVTSVATVVLTLFLLKGTTLGLGAFVLGPLVCGCLFNYWYWLAAGAKSLNTTWWNFTFRRSQ